MANPFVALSAADTSAAADELPLLKEWAWDFEHDVFLYDDTGRHITVTGNEALKVWIYKALKTERYRYECYRHGIYDINCDYGAELERYIGKHANSRETAANISAAVKECLLVNPYIQSVDRIDIAEREKDRLTLTVYLTSVYGELVEEVSV